ncbi:MAG: hypothetical protein ACLQVF_08085 [Isosphaeraceae bacterium]
MANRPEPDDVDLFLGGVACDAESVKDRARIIEGYKNRPDYPFEAEEAERILAALGIEARDYGMQDAKALLDHWHRCVAELFKPDSGGSGTTGVRNEDTGGGSRLPIAK